MTGIERITAERTRHSSLGWTAEHDAQHSPTDLLQASDCYAREKRAEVCAFEEEVPLPDIRYPVNWPWHYSWWKPTPHNRIRELEKAGALALAAVDRIAAEIDRIQAESTKEKGE